MTPSRETTGAAGARECSDGRRTRRGVLLGAAAGVGALAGCTSSGRGGGLGGSPTATDATAHPDVDALNYLLSLSYLEHALYQQGLSQFDERRLRSAGPVSQYGTRVRSRVPDRLASLRTQEKRHIEWFAAAVEELGGEPVTDGEYAFEFERAGGFLGTARVLENTVVAAYKGVTPAITTDRVLETVLSAHGVEGRHAGYLNLLVGEGPAPRAFDSPQAPRQVLEATASFVTSERQVADPTRRTDTPSATGSERPTAGSDVALLNDLLAVEHLLHALYRRGTDRFGEERLASADQLAGSGERRQAVGRRLRTIRDQTRAHVETLASTVRDHGGTPVQPGAYTFPLGSPTAFLRTARKLAPVGARAYAGGIPRARTETVRRALLQVHSVEARHAAYFALLAGGPPARTATTDPLSRRGVREATAPYVDRRATKSATPTPSGR